MKKIRNIFFGGFLVFLLCSFSICSAEAVYPVTPAELTELESILTELESINKALSSDLTISKQSLAGSREKLAKLQIRLDELRTELKTTKADLEQAMISLDEGKKLFKEFEKEEQSKRKKIILQRNSALILALALAFFK